MVQVFKRQLNARMRTYSVTDFGFRVVKFYNKNKKAMSLLCIFSLDNILSLQCQIVNLRYILEFYNSLYNLIVNLWSKKVMLLLQMFTQK